MKLTDAQGNVVASYTYGAYGELLSGNKGLTRFLYNGRCGVSTDDNGLYYMRQRYYNPEIKRFVNQDVVRGSLDNSQSLNRYSYVQGNPISYTDPFGLSPENGLFSGTGWVHSLFGLLGCVPGPIGIVANLADAAVYAFVDHDYTMALISGLSAFTMGMGSIAKAAAAGSKLARGAEYAAKVGSLISNGLNFAKNAHEAYESGSAIWNKYIVGDEKFGAEGMMEVAQLGMALLGCGMSARGVFSDTKELAKMMKEDDVLGRLKGAVSEGAAKVKCKAKEVLTGTAGCFVAGTKVKTAEGDRNIEELQVGDEVYAYDTLTGTIALKQVDASIVHEVSQLVHVTVAGEEIVTTVEHPFYVVGYGFKRAGDLQVGENVLSLDGRIEDIEEIWVEDLAETVTVYNLEVRDFHTYFVAELGVLVHNQYSAVCPSSQGRVRVDSYKAMKKDPNVTGQVHHLSQNAVFHDNIPREEGGCVELSGNAFSDIGSGHYEAHSSLESFWNKYRKGGELQGTIPTIGEYNRAVYDSLISTNVFTPQEAADAVVQMYQQQRLTGGLINWDNVPRIPNRMGQRK